MIYFIQSGEAGPIKIGTCNVDRLDARVQAIQTGNQHICNVIAVMPGDQSVERKAHSTLRQYRTRARGEWFSPAKEVFDFIDSHAVRHSARVSRFVERKARPERDFLTTPLEVIQALGGFPAIAELTGAKYRTAWMWNTNNCIPAKFFLVVGAALEKIGKRAAPAVFGINEPERAA